MATILPSHQQSTTAQPTALDILIEPEGYTLEASIYTYPQYVALMEEIGIVPSDFIFGEPPVICVLTSYQRGDAYVWQEVFEFASERAAEAEYHLQAEQQEYISGLGYKGNNGPIYQRFVPRERVFVHGRFLFLYFYSPIEDINAYGYMDDLLPIFISHILETSGTSLPEPPAIAVNAKWGLEPGDTLNWRVDGTTFTGSLGTGMSSSQEEWDGIWEIVDILEGYLRVKHRSMIKYVKTEDEIHVRVDVPYYSYTWHTPDENSVSLLSDDGSPAGAVLFSLELNGIPLVELVYESMDNLPEREITENNEYITVHGKTRQYSGLTPIETSWMDVTVHKGTGVVTSSDFYYNNNEYSITRSTGITLTYTSFPFNSRVAVTRSLTALMNLSATTLMKGDLLTVTVHVKDQDGEPMSDVGVTGSFNKQEYSLPSQGSGNYEATLGTKDLVEGSYSLYIDAEKSGYQGTTNFTSVVVEQNAAPTSSTTGQTGILGFPVLSIALGIALAIIVTMKTRR